MHANHTSPYTVASDLCWPDFFATYASASELIHLEHTPLISPEAHVVSCGSCFASRMLPIFTVFDIKTFYKQETCMHFSAASLAYYIERLAAGRNPDPKRFQILPDGTLHHWDYYAVGHSFSSIEEASSHLEDLDALFVEQIQQCTHFIFTMGTASTLYATSDGLPIVRAINTPPEAYRIQRTDVQAATEHLDRIFDAIASLRGDRPLTAFLTVSPQRYRFSREASQENPRVVMPGDVLIESALSKAVLQLAAEHYCVHHKTDVTAVYFPAYHIVIDELRSLDAFADGLHVDLVHTVHHVVRRFFAAYADAPLRERIRQVALVYTALAKGNLTVPDPDPLHLPSVLKLSFACRKPVAAAQLLREELRGKRIACLGIGINFRIFVKPFLEALSIQNAAYFDADTAIAGMHISVPEHADFTKFDLIIVSSISLYNIYRHKLGSAYTVCIDAA